MNTAWRSIGLSALAGVLFVIAIKPAPRPAFRFESDVSVLASEARTAAADADLLARITSRAEAAEMARALPPGRPGDAVFRFDAPLTPAAAARIEKSMREELAAIAPRGTAHPITVIARMDSFALGGSYRRTVVLPESADDPCVVIMGLSPQNLKYPGVFATDRLLGSCGFYAAFGAPGRGVAQWMRATNLELATHFQRPSSMGEGIDSIDVSSLANEPIRALASCAARRGDACVHALESPRTRWEDLWPWRRPSRALYERAPGAVPGVVAFDRYGNSIDANWLRAGLLSDLAAELGSERFGAIWRDDRSPAEAYEAREGRAFDEWIRERVLARVAPYRPGPWVAGVPLALALAVSGAAVYAGIRFARRELS
jgi:hypothetical protein